MLDFKIYNVEYYNFFLYVNELAVGNIDTSGISMLEELNKILGRRELKVKCP